MGAECLEVRFAGRGHAVDLEVVGVERGGRHVVLLSRDGEQKIKFLFRNPAHVRQGEWFFVPAPGVDPPLTHVLFDEPLFGGRGRAHVMQFAHRRLPHAQRRRGAWSRMVRDPEVFAKGAIRHPDHATIVLRDWHRVATNNEQAARAMRHVAFLD